MTSSVKVTAHCAKTKHVKVEVTGQPDVFIEDGESRDFVVFDEREINVKEVLKAE